MGHEVIAIAEQGEMRAMTDEEVFAWAATQGRWLLTENVKTSARSCCARCKLAPPWQESSTQAAVPSRVPERTLDR